MPVASQVDPLETMPVSRFARPIRWGLRLWFGTLIAFLYFPIMFMIAF